VGARRYEKPFVLLMDVDNFKFFNDLRAFARTSY
jgi:GGDEF domain-containing protein